MVNTVRPNPVVLGLRRVRRKCTLPTIMSTVRPPINKVQYSPNEIVAILPRLPKGSPNKSNLINHLVKEKLVPIKRQGIYKLLKINEDGVVCKEGW